MGHSPLLLYIELLLLFIVTTMNDIINNVWAAVYRIVVEVFSKNPLHSCFQSVVDSNRVGQYFNILPISGNWGDAIMKS